MSGRSVLQNLNEQSKAGVREEPRGRFRTKDIEITNLYPNSGNFYPVHEIEELALNIQTAGLLQNIVVTYDPDEEGHDYRIISGERRWRAMLLLLEQGNEQFRLVTCQIKQHKTETEERLNLIMANSYRVKDAATLLEEVAQLKNCLQELRAGGVREVNGVPLTEGKLRTAMARLLEISETKIAQLEAVNKNLIPEPMERIKDGTLAFSAAYQLAGLPKEEQERHAEASQPITEKQAREEREAQKRKELAARYAERECPVSGCFCDNAENLAGYYRDGATAGCPGCCANCNNAATCDNACTEMRTALENTSGWESEYKGGEEEGPELELQPQELPLEPHPEHATSACYTCAHWDECTEKSDRVTRCDRHELPQARASEKSEPIAAHSANAISEPAIVLGFIRHAIDLQADPIMHVQEHALLDALWKRWNETGGWR